MFSKVESQCKVAVLTGAVDKQVIRFVQYKLEIFVNFICLQHISAKTQSKKHNRYSIWNVWDLIFLLIFKNSNKNSNPPPPKWFDFPPLCFLDVFSDGARLWQCAILWLWRVCVAHLLQVINHHSFMRLWVFRRDSGSPLLLLPAIHPATR